MIFCEVGRKDDVENLAVAVSICFTHSLLVKRRLQFLQRILEYVHGRKILLQLNPGGFTLLCYVKLYHPLAHTKLIHNSMPCKKLPHVLLNFLLLDERTFKSCLVIFKMFHRSMMSLPSYTCLISMPGIPILLLRWLHMLLSP